MVVAFITLLKALIEVTPVAFLSLAQTQGGNFDYTFVSNMEAPLKDQDVNFYDTAPWEYDSDLYGWEKPKQDSDDVDHVEIFGLNLLNFDYFKKVLDPLNGHDFRGFSPRWTYPAKIRNPNDHSKFSAVLAHVLDSKREVDLNMQPHFSNTVLGQGEVIVS